MLVNVNSILYYCELVKCLYFLDENIEVRIRKGKRFVKGYVIFWCLSLVLYLNFSKILKMI